MKRTNSITRHTVDIRRVLPLLLLLLAGCVCGVIVYAAWRDDLPSSVLSLLAVRPVADGLRGGFSQLFTSCFQTLCLLAVLFVSGLSACGAPVACAVPLFWGIGLGLTQAYYYTHGGVGVLLTAIFVLPHSIPEAAALLTGCTLSLRLSVQLMGQLLPRGAHCGGLWQAFRAYCVQFLLLLPLLLAAGAVDVALRALLLRFFPAALIAG